MLLVPSCKAFTVKGQQEVERALKCSSFGFVSRVSRADHPPGSAEGTSLASDILRRFRKLQMDHTWAESLYATLQFPDRCVDQSHSVVCGDHCIFTIKQLD